MKEKKDKSWKWVVLPMLGVFLWMLVGMTEYLLVVVVGEVVEVEIVEDVDDRARRNR